MGLTGENARDFGQPGSRPTGRLRKSKQSLHEFAGMVVTDPMVQQRILKQARAGTLPPRLLIELFHYWVGPPPSEFEPPPPDPTRAERRAQLGAQIARLSMDEQVQYADLLRKMLGTAGTDGPAELGHKE